jgi:hypothetical protein
LLEVFLTTTSIAHGAFGAFDELIALGLALVIILVAMLMGRGKPKE